MSRSTHRFPSTVTESRFAGAVGAAIEAALRAVDPEESVRRHVRLDGDILTIGSERYRTSELERIVLSGVGKAAQPMAKAVTDILGSRIDAGVLIAHEGGLLSGGLPGTIRSIEAGHPLPNTAGVRGAEQIIQKAAKLGESDLLLLLISGGTSSLMTLPAKGLTLEELQETTMRLLKAGADITALNAVRKHLSAITGGQLAAVAHPAAIVSIVLSDVIGDDLAVVGSGPVSPDPSTFDDALGVLAQYGLLDKVPKSVVNRLISGRDRRVAETLKPGDPVFEKVQHLIVGSNRQAVLAAANAIDELDYNVEVDTTPLEGEAREAGRVAGAKARSLLSDMHVGDRPRCLVLGGETTVTVKGPGKGGRNQELALSAALELDGLPDVLVVAFATDGRDGPTDAAGAAVTGDTVQRARRLGMDARQYLRANDSYHFFKPLNDLIVTGPTRTNVADLLLIFLRESM